MAVRIICWNIKNFSEGTPTSTIARAGVQDRILSQVHPPGAARIRDVFIILEATALTTGVVRGERVDGGGTTAALTLLGTLRGRPGGAGWQLVPPICLKRPEMRATGERSGTGESIAAFYHEDAVIWRGPATANLGGAWSHAVTEGVAHWIDRTAAPPTLQRADFDAAGAAQPALPADAALGVAALDAATAYYVDTRRNAIMSWPFAGGGATVVHTPACAARPRALALTSSGSHAFWIDGATRDVVRGDVAGRTAAAFVRTADASHLVVAHNLVAWLDSADQLTVDAHAGGARHVIGAVAGVTETCAIGDLMFALAGGNVVPIDLASHTIAAPIAIGAGAHSLCAGGNDLFWIDATEQIRWLDRTGNAVHVVLDVVATNHARALATSATALYWVDLAGTLMTAGLDGSSPMAVAHAGPVLELRATPGGVSWIDTSHALWRAVPGHAAATIVSAATAGQPTSLAAVASHVAWVDVATHVVMVAADDGTGATPLGGLVAELVSAGTAAYWLDDVAQELRWVQHDGTGPGGTAALAATGLAVDPRARPLGANAQHVGWLYWTNTGNQIVGIDPGALGAGPQVVVPAASCGTPASLEVTAQDVVWIDGASHELRGVTIAGFAGQRVIVAGVAAGARGLARSPVGGHVGWTTPGGDLVVTGTGAGARARVIVRAATGVMGHAPRIVPGAHRMGRAQASAAHLAGPTFWLADGNISCPLVLRFQEVGGANEFDLIAHHAPEPGDGNRLTSAREIATLTAAPGTYHVRPRFTYMGDLNLCGRGAPGSGQPACGDYKPTVHEDNWTALHRLNQAFTHGGGGAMLVWHQLSSFKAKGTHVPTAAAMTAAEWTYHNHAYDHIMARGHTGVANNQVLDVVAQAITDYYTAGGVQLTEATFKTDVLRFWDYLVSVGPGQSKGVSDHLPVVADLSF